MAKNLPKKLTRAPLVYVLAQIRFSSILTMAKYIPELQDELRHAGYPRFTKRQMRLVRLNLGAPVQEAPEIYPEATQWGFSNKDESSGYLIAADSFVFHTAQYHTHELFFRDLETGLRLVHKFATIGLVERTGLRYVDVVEPMNGDSLEQYLASGLAGFPLGGVGTELNSVMTETLSNTKYGRMRMRCVQNRDGMLLPLDLQPPGLAISRTINPGTMTALLDFDHFSEQSGDFSVEGVVERLQHLHDVAREAFRIAVTDHAVARWQ